MKNEIKIFEIKFYYYFFRYFVDFIYIFFNLYINIIMVLIALILVFTSMGSLETWELSRNDQYDLIESWGIESVQGRDKIKNKFQEKPHLSCNDIYKTTEAPFVAVILYQTSGRLLCMGTIIDNLHVLTAKRCYEKVDPAEVKVLVGCFKAYWGRFSQVLPVKKIIRHEYEVAILRLSTPLRYTKYVQAVKLPPSVTKMITEFIKPFPPPYKVAGFLVDRYDVPGDFIGKEKYYQLLQDNFVEFEECKTNFTKLVLEPNKLFCTIGNATYCWGGWGAPVLKWMAANDYFLQVGVVVADNCTTTETGPLLAARTDVYGDWIQGNSFQGHQPT